MTFIAVTETSETAMLVPQESEKDSPRSSFGGSTNAETMDAETSDSDDLGSSISWRQDAEEDDDIDGSLKWAVNVKNTFIDVPIQDMSFPQRSSRHRRRSVPACLGAQSRH